MNALSRPTLAPPLRPFEALRAVRRLLSNPEDTRQVFVILSALRGRSGQRMFRRFAASPTGAAVLVGRSSLLDRLDDEAGLARLPEGSLGRAYLAFMQAEHLSAGGLVDASMTEDLTGLPPDARLFRERMRDMHDLTHVVTGYGRDSFGELCLLTFMFPQTRNPGQAFIAIMGFLKFGRGTDRRPMAAGLVEAWRRGRRARWLPEQDWAALLAWPLADVRQTLRLDPPARYVALRP